MNKIILFFLLLNVVCSSVVYYAIKFWLCCHQTISLFCPISLLLASTVRTLSSVYRKRVIRVCYWANRGDISGGWSWNVFSSFFKSCNYLNEKWRLGMNSCSRCSQVLSNTAVPNEKWGNFLSADECSLYWCFELVSSSKRVKSRRVVISMNVEIPSSEKRAYRQVLVKFCDLFKMLWFMILGLINTKEKQAHAHA